MNPCKEPENELKENSVKSLKSGSIQRRVADPTTSTLHIDEAETESETIYQTDIPGIERSHANENEAFNPLVEDYMYRYVYHHVESPTHT